MVEELRETFAAASVREGFTLVHYSVQHDHVHMLVEADDEGALGRGMKSIGARIARAVNRVFGRTGEVMAGRYHSRLLKSPRQVFRALRYVLLNWRKHCLGRTGRPGPAKIDEASSGQWFDGWRDAPARAPTTPREVAPPRTWLLRTGWRIHGTIALSEIPGTSA